MSGNYYHENLDLQKMNEIQNNYKSRLLELHDSYRKIITILDVELRKVWGGASYNEAVSLINIKVNVFYECLTWFATCGYTIGARFIDTYTNFIKIPHLAYQISELEVDIEEFRNNIKVTVAKDAEHQDGVIFDEKRFKELIKEINMELRNAEGTMGVLQTGYRLMSGYSSALQQWITKYSTRAVSQHLSYIQSLQDMTNKLELIVKNRNVTAESNASKNLN